MNFIKWTRVNKDGGNSDEATPVPIPNTAVKLISADGTALATVWESRSPPSSLFTLDFYLYPVCLFIDLILT